MEELSFLYGSKFARTGRTPPVWEELPLPDEPFAEDWRAFLAGGKPAFETLRERLVQLSFPVAPGVSARAGYRDAVKRGIAPKAGAGLALTDEKGLRAYAHPTPAGTIIVIEANNDADFALLLSALSRKNEPADVPPAMGAAFLRGLADWSRVRLWMERGKTFSEIRGTPALYQDTFLLLSGRPYSGVAARQAGVPERDWGALSRAIRLGHETAHYMTKRFFGVAENDVHDEIAADYWGLTEAVGSYRADWFLSFMGLEQENGYRAGGRLENYTRLTGESFGIVCETVRRAARRIGELCGPGPLDAGRRYQIFLRLCATPVAHMAQNGFAQDWGVPTAEGGNTLAGYGRADRGI